MRLDDILEEIGGFGPFQKWVFFLTCIANLIAGFFMINPVFLLAVPDHRCSLPSSVYSNDTYEIQSEYHRQLVDQYIPQSSDPDKLHYDPCNLYKVNDNGSGYESSHRVQNNQSQSTLELPTESCDSWVYDKTDFKATFATQINLVCGDEIKVANAEMIFYGGMLLGSIASGIIADKYGRKPVMYIALLVMIATSIGLAWANSYWLFVAIEFVLGASIVAMFMPAYIISLEITSVNKRVWPGVIADFPYVGGLVLLAAIAYGLKDWFDLQLYTALPGIIFISYWWLMPESPRWLLTKGRVKEAEQIIRKAAKWNKATLPDKLFDVKSADDEDKSASFLHLFSSKKQTLRTILVFFNWTVVALAYFGLALNSDNLAGNVYLNFGLSALVEIPAYFVVIFLVDRIGRRKLYCINMIIGGIACGSTIFAIEYVPNGTGSLTVALAMAGKFFVTAAYSTTYIHSAEIFPTVVRNAGLGGASVFARIGTMVAPYIVVLGEEFGGSWGEALPLLVFGIMSFLSGITSLLLPETLNKNLPETVEDGERFGRSGAFYFVRSLRLHKNEYTDLKEDSEHELLLSKSDYHER